MAISTDVSTLAWLLQRSNDELVNLWRELDAPTLEEMDGEYQGHMCSNAVEHATIRKQEGPGEWVGKAFSPTPTDRHPGQGYNLWFDGEKVVRTMRFGGEVGPSLIDGRPALLGHYSAFASHNSYNGMTNEVRKLGEGLFVGIISTAVDHAYWGPVDPATGRGRPHSFVLRGPLGSFTSVDDVEIDAPIDV